MTRTLPALILAGGLLVAPAVVVASEPADRLHEQQPLSRDQHHRVVASPTGAVPAHEQETGPPAGKPRSNQPMSPTAGAYVGRRLAAADERPRGSPNFAKTAASSAGPVPAANRDGARLQARERAIERALQRQARRLPSDGRASR